MIDEASGYREQSLKQNTRSNDKVETLMSVKSLISKLFKYLSSVSLITAVFNGPLHRAKKEGLALRKI